MPTAKARKKKATKKRTPQRGKIARNGMTNFVMHVNEKRHRGVFDELASASKPSAKPRAAALMAASALDPETAALQYLEGALESDKAKKFVRPKLSGKVKGRTEPSEFKSLGAEAVPLTGTTVVKFRQMFHQIPVYGSLVTVELDAKKQLVGLYSALGTPKKVPHIAKVSPAEALARAAKEAGQPVSRLSNTPRLYFFFQASKSKWHLAYIIEDVPQAKRKPSPSRGASSPWKDYIIDAQTGALLAALPRTPAASVASSGTDGLAKQRHFRVERLGQRKVLRNIELNVTTYDFAFKDPWKRQDLLPGTLIAEPPNPWPREAVSAHANAEIVAQFLRKVLKRNNIDNKGGEMRSSVNCWDKSEGTDPPKQWANAYWDGDQMVYGQVLYPDESFFSIANMLDVVGHEMFHGVTDMTSRLEYETQSGALNESYSDIFGVIIANYKKPLARWTWELGQGFDGPGQALRDLEDPTRHDQPKTMAHFLKSRPPYDDRNDNGHVHDNSGIHNFAAFKIMTAQAGGRYLFTAKQLAQMFYIALTVHLSRTSHFSDSRRAVLQAAQSLFRNESAAKRDQRLAAIEAGFRAAGILDDTV